ncbi:hypothetical protein BDV12DRAFT_158173 [Aspergillus spectabilis]
MKSVLSLTATQLLVSYVAALPSLIPLSDRTFPWHITVPKGHAPVKRQNLPTTWDPPADLVTPLEEVWQHQLDTYSDALGFQNYGFDQVIAAGGKINYCVRWDSTSTLTASQREQISAAASRSFNKWIAGLAGFGGWPYDTVQVNVVGYAVNDVGLLEGDTSGADVYTTVDSEGVPQCEEACGRFFHQDGDYSFCPGGKERHYDQSLWLTDGFEGGTGGDWGQRVGSEYFLENVEADNIHIYLHEIGHTFALDDFYDWTPTGVTNFIMLAGSATEITEFDYWMLRDWWRNLKDRYDLSGAVVNSGSDSSSGSGSGSYNETNTETPATNTGIVSILPFPAETSSAPAPGVPTPVTPSPSPSSSAVLTFTAVPSATPTLELPGSEEATDENPWGGHGSGEHPWQGHPWWSGISWPWRGKSRS